MPNYKIAAGGKFTNSKVNKTLFQTNWVKFYMKIFEISQKGQENNNNTVDISIKTIKELF